MARLWFPTDLLKRDKRFLIISILALTIAIGIVDGTLIYIDSSVSGYLDKELSWVDIDYVFDYNPLGIDEGTLELQELKTYIQNRVPAITDMVDGVTIEISQVNGHGFWNDLCGSSPRLFEVFPQEFNLTTGILNFTANGAAMERNRAEHYNISIGDQFNASFTYYEYDTWGEENEVTETLNYTLRATYELGSRQEGSHSYLYNPIEIITDMAQLQTDLHQFPLEEMWEGDLDYHGLIFVKTDHNAITSFTAQVYYLTITPILNEIRQEFLPDLEGVDNHLAWAVYQFIEWYRTQQLIFTVLAIPLLACGWLIAKHVVDIKTSHRRTEVGILKSRGATTRQIQTVLNVEALLSGLIGGLAALPVGFGAGWLMIRVKSFLIFDVFTIPRYPLGFPLWVILLSIGMTIILQFLGYSGTSQVVGMTVVDATAKVSSEERVTTPWVSICFLILLSLPTWMIIQMPAILNVGLYGMGSFLAVGYLVVFIFVFAIARLLAHMAPRLRAYLVNRLSRFIDPVSTKLITRRSRLITKNDVYGVMFLGLIIGVGFSGIISAASADNHAINVTHYYVGADIRLDLPNSNITNLQAFTSQLETLDGIDKATGALAFGGRLENQHHLQCLAVDPLQFRDTAFTKFARQFPPDQLLDLIFQTDIWENLNNTPNGIIISRELSLPGTYPAPIRIGDYVDLSVMKFIGLDPVFVHGNMTVIGYLDSILVDHEDPYGMITILNLDYVNTLLGEDTQEQGKIFIKTHNDVNGTLLSHTIQTTYNDTTYTITNAQTYLDEVSRSQGSQIIQGFFSLNFIMAIIFCSLGLFLILALRFEHRLREMAILRAVGLDANELKTYITADALTLAIAGLLFGAILGWTLAALGVKGILMFMGFSYDLTNVYLPMELIYPPIHILALIAITLITAYTIAILSTKTFLSHDIFQRAKLDVG